VKRYAVHNGRSCKVATECVQLSSLDYVVKLLEAAAGRGGCYTAPTSAPTVEKKQGSWASQTFTDEICCNLWVSMCKGIS